MTAESKRRDGGGEQATAEGKRQRRASDSGEQSTAESNRQRRAIDSGEQSTAESNQRDGGEKLAMAVESKRRDGGGEQGYCAAYRGKYSIEMRVSHDGHVTWVRRVFVYHSKGLKND